MFIDSFRTLERPWSSTSWMAARCLRTVDGLRVVSTRGRRKRARRRDRRAHRAEFGRAYKAELPNDPELNPFISAL